MDQVVAQQQRIAEVFEGESMLREAWLAGKAGDVAHRDDKMIVFQLRGSRTKAGGRCHCFTLQVDRLDFAGVKIGLWAETADGRDRIQDADAP